MMSTAKPPMWIPASKLNSNPLPVCGFAISEIRASCPSPSSANGCLESFQSPPAGLAPVGGFLLSSGEYRVKKERAAKRAIFAKILPLIASYDFSMKGMA